LLTAVVYDRPGHREEFKDGLATIPKWDSARYVEEVIHLLRNDSYRNALGYNCRKTMENCDWARISDDLLTIIRDIEN
jgi:hypothetical protein